MEQEIYVTEIQKSGIVSAVQGALKSNCNIALPNVGDNLFEFYDTNTSNFFNLKRELIFNEKSPCTFVQTVNQQTIHLTFHCHKKDVAFIYWQLIPETDSNKLVKRNEDKPDDNSKRNELHTSLSLDFIDGISLPIFELIITPKDEFHFVYANNEMHSLFPNLNTTDIISDLSLVLSSIHSYDKDQFINSLKNINPSRPWNPEFRLQIGKEIKWKKGYGHFSQLSESNSYVLRAYLKDITDKKRATNHTTLLEFAFRNAVTPMYFVNDDASFYDFNDAANNILGYSREELMSRMIFDVDIKSLKENWNEFWIWIKANRTSIVETIHQKKDGTLMKVQIVSNLINYEGKELLCAYIFDLTERNKLENEVLLADFLFNHLHTAIHIIAKDGSVFKSNPAAQKLMGYSEEAYHKLHISDIDPLFNETVWPAHWEELKIVGNMTSKKLNKKSNGTIIPVEITTNFLNFEGQELTFVFFSDITQKVAEEERLRLLESVVLNTNDSVIITDFEIGEYVNPTIIYVNDAFTQLTGYLSKEVLGKNPRFLQSGKSDQKELNKMREAIRELKACEATLINVRKNGEEYWVSTHINPVADKEGNFTHFIAVQRDITQQKLAELERERVMEELVAKNKKLREFSFITTHDLRAPLTNLLSASRMLKTETVANPLTRTLIDVFKKSTLDLNDTLNTLINTLLIQESKNVLIERLKFSKILEIVCSKNSHSIANTCCLITSDFSSVDEVDFNAEYLESIFQNLITNSIKYSDSHRQTKIIIKSKIIDSKTIQLIFTDNGIGMDMKLIKDRIFGLNQRFHDHVDSKGVGLYLIYNQLKTLGGNITVTSEERVGTTFFVSFKRK